MVFTDNRQSVVDVTEELNKLIESIVDYTLKHEGVTCEYEVSIIYTDNLQIKELNSKFRNIHRETDVLSFPMLEYPENKTFKDVYVNYKFDDSYLDEGKLVIGDIALSLEKAKEQSNDFGHSFYRECTYLTVHSVLHLLGYDHMEEEQKSAMRFQEEIILNAFNQSR